MADAKGGFPPEGVVDKELASQTSELHDGMLSSKSSPSINVSHDGFEKPQEVGSSSLSYSAESIACIVHALFPGISERICIQELGFIMRSVQFKREDTTTDKGARDASFNSATSSSSRSSKLQKGSSSEGLSDRDSLLSAARSSMDLLEQISFDPKVSSRM